MMKAEQETQILINQADWVEGFFRWSTTFLPHYRKLCRRIPKTAFRTCTPIVEKGGVIGYEITLPLAYLSRAHFGLRKSLPVAGSRARIASQKNGGMQK